MPTEHDRISFRMMEIDFEWDGATRTLESESKAASDALRELVRGVLEECSGPAIPAMAAVVRSAERLAQRVTILRIE